MTAGEHSQLRTRVAGGAGSAAGHVTQLPIARVKLIIKTDPDTSLASQEAVLLVTKVTSNKTLTPNCNSSPPLHMHTHTHTGH